VQQELSQHRQKTALLCALCLLLLSLLLALGLLLLLLLLLATLCRAVLLRQQLLCWCRICCCHIKPVRHSQHAAAIRCAHLQLCAAAVRLLCCVMWAQHTRSACSVADSKRQQCSSRLT
jgi:hypothetical protein